MSAADSCDHVPGRLLVVRNRIAVAEKLAKRAPGSVRLLAVSKRHSSQAIRVAYAEGQRDFGENYVQELLAKREELRDLADLRLHMIGHVQRNKARAVCSAAEVVHSVDSVRLVQALGRHRLAERGAEEPLEIFVQVKLSQEADKTGCLPEHLREILGAVEEQQALQLAGLMLIGARPGVTSASVMAEGPESAERHFAELLSLREQHGGIERMPELSLGMSGDLEAAVAHGSTCVRVGTDIFGARG